MAKDKRPKESRRKTPPKALPGARQEGHPNLKKGEQYGETGAGPKPKFVRERLLRIANDGLDYYEKVARGNKVIVVPSGFDGVPDGLRKPSHRERSEVIDAAFRHGLPQKVEVTLEREDLMRLAVDAMHAEGLPQETIAAVVKRLAQAIKDG